MTIISHYRWKKKTSTTPYLTKVTMRQCTVSYEMYTLLYFAHFITYYIRNPFILNDFAPDLFWISPYMRKVFLGFSISILYTQYIQYMYNVRTFQLLASEQRTQKKSYYVFCSGLNTPFVVTLQRRVCFASNRWLFLMFVTNPFEVLYTFTFSKTIWVNDLVCEFKS